MDQCLATSDDLLFDFLNCLQLSKYADEVDHPLGWIKDAAVQDSEHEIQRRADMMEREIQKRTFDITKSNRMSR
jgi:hypothetical protein